MNDATLIAPPKGPCTAEIALARLIERHGAWETLRAMARVLTRHRRRRPRAEKLPNHLRRDIGLPPAPEPGRRYWELR